MSLNKLKLCSECQELKVIWKNYEGNKYCLGCWNKIKPRAVPKPKKAINKVSEKRKIEQKEYSSSRVDYLIKYPYCVCKHIGCIGYATQIHHMAGRTGNLYLDQENWIGVCHNCHEWIELHPEEAKELGFSKSRL